MITLSVMWGLVKLKALNTDEFILFGMSITVGIGAVIADAIILSTLVGKF